MLLVTRNWAELTILISWCKIHDIAQAPLRITVCHSFIHSFIAICIAHYVENVESEAHRTGPLRSSRYSVHGNKWDGIPSSQWTKWYTQKIAVGRCRWWHAPRLCGALDTRPPFVLNNPARIFVIEMLHMLSLSTRKQKRENISQ